MAEKKPYLRFLAKICISIGFLGWCFNGVKLGAIVQSLVALPILVVVLVWAFNLVALSINAYKWGRLLPGYAHGALLAQIFVAQFYSLILPGQIAGEAVKAYRLGKGRLDAEKIAASVVIDRITGFIGMLLVGLSGVLFGDRPNVRSLPGWILLALVALCAGLYLVKVEIVYRMVRALLVPLREGPRGRIAAVSNQLLRFIGAWRLYLDRPTVLLISALIGVVFQMVCVLFYYILSSAFVMPISLFDWCWILALVSILVFLPITIGGVGLREAGLVVLLEPFGVPTENALAFSFVIFGLQLSVAAIGGAFELRRIFLWNRNKPDDGGHQNQPSGRR